MGRKHGTIGKNEREEGAMKQEKAYYHLPGLFEFYELYREFLPCTGGIGNTSMTGAALAPSTEHRPTASGAGDAPVSAGTTPKRSLH